MDVVNIDTPSDEWLGNGFPRGLLRYLLLIMQFLLGQKKLKTLP